METVFPSTLAIITGVFGTLILTGNFKDIFKRKFLFVKIDRFKIIRLSVMIFYVIIAVALEYFYAKNKIGNGTNYLLLFALLGIILTFVSFKFLKPISK